VSGLKFGSWKSVLREDRHVPAKEQNEYYIGRAFFIYAFVVCRFLIWYSVIARIRQLAETKRLRRSLKTSPSPDLGGIFITVSLPITNPFPGAGIAIIYCNNLISEEEYNSCHYHQQGVSSEFFKQFFPGHI